MTKQLGLVILAVAAVLWTPFLAAEDTVESIEKAVVEQWEKLNSVSATFDLVADVVLNPEVGKPVHVIGGGSADYLKKGDKRPSRVEAWVGTNPEFKMAQAKVVSDGTTAHVETTVFGNVNTETVDVSAVAVGGKELFAQARKHLDLSAMPSTKIDDKDVYVLEGTPKDQNADIPVKKVRGYFAIATGIPLKISLFDGSGTEMGTVTMMDININQELSDSLFVYVAPAPPAPKPAEPK